MRKASLVIVFCALLSVLMLVVFELGGRAFMMVEFKTTFSEQRNMLFEYYQNTLYIRNDHKSLPPEQVRILLLGGSVLNPNNGTIAKHLKKELDLQFGPDGYWVYNDAIPGHSSRDSYLKTRLLEELQFDVVVFYHGINEVRANNCPEEIFDDRYRHYAWYEEVQNGFDHWLEPEVFVSRFLFDHILIRMKQKLFPNSYVPEAGQQDDWFKYGAEVKTVDSFRSNLKGIANWCNETGAELVVPTFAHHLDPAYTRELYEGRKLDYNPKAEHLFAVELWGEPENVVAGIEAHNSVVIELKDSLDFHFYDMEAVLEDGAMHFDDICHLSDSGSARFTQLLFPTILEAASKGSRLHK